MPIISIGIDLAKHIFVVHGVNENRQAELVKPKVSRGSAPAAHRQFTTLHHRYGSLLRRTLLGTSISSAWPHHQTHGAEVRHLLPHER